MTVYNQVVRDEFASGGILGTKTLKNLKTPPGVDVAMHFLYWAPQARVVDTFDGKPRLGRRPMTGVETWLPPLLFPSVAER